MPTAVARLIEDNFKCPISYTGHGLQRALVLALLQQLSVVDIYQEDERDREDAAEESGQENLPGLILAIEEPELYLHPARSRYLSKLLDSLVQPPESSDDPRTQLLIATHSPFFLDIEKFERIRVARKTTIAGYDVLQSTYTKFTRAAAIRLIAQIADVDEAVVSAEGFVTRAAPIMTPLVNEGFFADVVVIVEGIGDAAILMAVQEAMRKNWDACGITVVPAEGKTKIDRPVIIFDGLGIPTYFIFDGDNRHRGKKEEASAVRSNSLLLRLAKAKVVHFPETQVNPTWAVFGNDIESELEAVNPREFQTIRAEVSAILDHGNPPSLLKNPQGASMFIRRWYDAGHTVPVLEQIVEHITSLLPARSAESGGEDG